MNVQADKVRPNWSYRGNCLARSSLAQIPSRPPHRVVTVASLSRRIADYFVSETLAGAVKTETGGSVLLLHLEMSEGRASLQDWTRVQPQVNGEFGLAQYLEQDGAIAKLRIRLTEDTASSVTLARRCQCPS